MSGCTNLLVGRRGNFEKCKYWVRDEEEKELDEYVYNTVPSGVFYVKEITAEDLRKTQVNNLFMFDESLTTLFTSDSVMNLKKGDLIEYNGDVWVAQSVQIKKVAKNRQFMARPSVEVYVQVKK